MKVALFSSHRFEQPFLLAANQTCNHALHWIETRLNLQTVPLANGFPAVSCFVTDDLSGPVLEQLSRQGIRLIALRSAGFNHVDMVSARRLGLTVSRVPNYSP